MVMCGIRRINGKSYIDQKEVLKRDLLSKMLIDQPLVGNGSCALIKKKFIKNMVVLMQDIKEELTDILEKLQLITQLIIVIGY